MLRYYLLLISIHGLIRGKNPELGRDADTGGQTKYIIDLATALSQRDDVSKVDLVTRRIVDSSLSKDYSSPIEMLSNKARIIRIDAGPEKYILKEQLWDYLDSYTDNLIRWLNVQPRRPDVVHSHYADAGYVGVRVANLLGMPLVHTGHSLGRDKRKRLLAKGLSSQEVEQTYNMRRRINAEEEVLANADLVITSTHNEVEQQYSLYNYYNPASMAVIPPGTDLQQFHPPLENEKQPLNNQLQRFLKDPDKPLILALSRPDERKNILTLVEAFGESADLQRSANLLIIAGSRVDIRDMDPGPRSVLSNILLLIDYYDLYGKVAFPKSHRPDEVPAIYRMVTLSGGVFINPALTEPFGLTILEAAASGLPVVATENGGPVDIIANCHNGELVDPLDRSAIINALLKLLQDRKAWEHASHNGIEGVTEFYSWDAHAERYLDKIRQLSGHGQSMPSERPAPRMVYYRERAIFTDLDQSLLGNSSALERFCRIMRDNRKCVTFGITTGRRIDTTLAVIKKYRIPTPDVLVTSLGTRIHYGQSLIEDDYWAEHIDHQWNPLRVCRLLYELPGLMMQPKIEQSRFKLSFFYDSQTAPSVEQIITLIRQKELTANVFLSFGQYLDIVPVRASKGQALRYVAQRLGIPLEQILVAGGSGADEDMMRGKTLAVVVNSRHHAELEKLEDHENTYFASQPHALGILEAIEYYDFFSACITPGLENA